MEGGSRESGGLSAPPWEDGCSGHGRGTGSLGWLGVHGWWTDNRWGCGGNGWMVSRLEWNYVVKWCEVHWDVLGLQRDGGKIKV